MVTIPTKYPAKYLDVLTALICALLCWFIKPSGFDLFKPGIIAAFTTGICLIFVQKYMIVIYTYMIHNYKLIICEPIDNIINNIDSTELKLVLRYGYIADAWLTGTVVISVASFLEFSTSVLCSMIFCFMVGGSIAAFWRISRKFTEIVDKLLDKHI